MDVVAVEERLFDFESQDVADEAGSFVFGVPVARDLFSLGAVQHGIEDGLVRESRRKCAEVGGGNEVELALADGAVEGDDIRQCVPLHSSVTPIRATHVQYCA